MFLNNCIMTFISGDEVTLIAPLPFLKTNDATAMLRPPDLVSLGEIGHVVSVKSDNIVEVQFRRGIFLISSEKLTRRMC